MSNMEAGNKRDKRDKDGKERFAIECDPTTREKLYDTAKRFKLTQGEVLEVIFGETDVAAAYGKQLWALRAQKVRERTEAKEERARQRKLEETAASLSVEDLERILEERRAAQQS